MRNRKWSEDELLQKRREVLARWPTAQGIDLDEAVEYRRALPASQKWVDTLARAKKEGRILVSAYVGHATVEDTLGHLKFLEENGGDLLTVLPDTYSRRGRYAEAENALQASIKQGKSLLNGFPIVNHGLANARRIREQIGVPVQVNSSDAECCELLADFAMAAGFERTSGDVETALRTSLKAYTLEAKIIETQYMNRLAGYYTERGAPVMTKLHNCLCGLDPPEIKVAIGTLHALLVAEQGVEHITQEVSLGCHVIQDVAALRSVRQLTEEYLRRFGYSAEVSLACFPFGSVWPREQNRAAATGALNVAIPVLAGADWFPIKTFHEAVGIPTREANLWALRAAKHVVRILGSQRLDLGAELATEMQMITAGARAIIDKTLEIGDGDAATGQIKAVGYGIIDGAFSPWDRARGKAFPLRDVTGAIRYLDAGNIPLPPEVLEYHRAKVAERERAEPNKKRYEMMVKDVYYVSGEAMA